MNTWPGTCFGEHCTHSQPRLRSTTKAHAEDLLLLLLPYWSIDNAGCQMGMYSCHLYLVIVSHMNFPK